MNRLKKTLKMLKSGVSTILTVFIVFIVAFVVQTQMTGGNAQVLDYEILTVLSGSMEPDIQTGSVIAIEATDQSREYSEGDVITYAIPDDPDTYVTHRVVDVQQNEGEISYVTQGDNSSTPDRDPVQSEQVVGHYNGITIPYLGYAVDYAKSDQGIVLMLIAPGFLLLISSFVQVWRIVRDTEQPKEIAATEAVETDKQEGHEKTL
ncbi:signal peptidase, endoplasmic reticulum-type [Natribacillus halophilus]|uniref:Signal peptidase I n=1 Tax=Natribacillus halophilus TaxID=549003 RepID=A0A1G8KTG4_9BACI|nr:signal peptidase, endoplasmic reticulum-type [Natribacillus halophilus]